MIIPLQKAILYCRIKLIGAEVCDMGWNYNKLWKLLIDKGMNKTELREKLRIGPVQMAKMTKGEPVSMDVLEKICKGLECNISDIVDFVPDA